MVCNVLGSRRCPEEHVQHREVMGDTMKSLHVVGFSNAGGLQKNTVLSIFVLVVLLCGYVVAEGMQQVHT